MFSNTAQWDPDRFQNVQLSMSEELEQAFGGWVSFLVEYAQEFGSMHNKVIDEHRHNSLVTQADIELTPVQSARYVELQVVLPAVLSEVPKSFLHGAIHGFFRTFLVVRPDEPDISMFARIGNEKLFTVLWQTLNVEGALHHIDEIGRSTDQDVSPVVSILKAVENLFRDKAAEIRAERQKLQDATSWFAGIAKGELPDRTSSERKGTTNDDLKRLIESLKAKIAGTKG